jgi:DNA-binding response OmpR family regulator
MGARVMVVDDNEDVARITARMLTTAGFTPVVALDGERALTMIAQEPPECVLLDIMMPNMSGLEVLNRLRENAATAGIPVILVTAKNRDEDVLAGYKEGADYYITKPFSSKQLVYGLRLVLGKKSAAATTPAE